MLGCACVGGRYTEYTYKYCRYQRGAKAKRIDISPGRRFGDDVPRAAEIRLPLWYPHIIAVSSSGGYVR